MPDWESFVRQQLAGLALESEAKSEVISELAARLEETYDSLLAAGLTQADAERRTHSQVPDWSKLQETIVFAREKEGRMNNRVTQMWLPSLFTLAVAMGLQPLLAMLGLAPRFLGFGGLTQKTDFLSVLGAWQLGLPHFSVYTAWLLALPLTGALGAYFSRRTGGAMRAMIISGIFPALAFAMVILLIVPFSMALEHWSGTVSQLVAILTLLAVWVFIPWVCLLSGVLVYQSAAQRRQVMAAR